MLRGAYSQGGSGVSAKPCGAPNGLFDDVKGMYGSLDGYGVRQ